MKISFLKKISGNRRKLTIAGILVVAIVHSAGQLFFVQDENFRSAELTAQNEPVKFEESKVEQERSDGQIIAVKPEEYEMRKVKVSTISENNKSISRRQVEAAPPKKKAVRETKEARLRRAERILTGV
jgi:hypothetical protein